MPENKSTTWSLTINNPTAEDREQINIARSRGWRVEGQKEVGENGTVHLQLLLRTPHIRFGAVKKTFTRAHIEVARNVAALQNYVHKEETRVGELADETCKWPSMGEFCILVLQQHLTRPWDDKDGLNCDDLERGVLRWCHDERPINDPEKWLEILDVATADLVLKGYHVERYAVNPQFRSSWKKFAPQMLGRALSEWIEKSTAADAAAETVRLSHERIAAALDYNHASQDVSQEAHQSPPSQGSSQTCPPLPSPSDSDP